MLLCCIPSPQVQLPLLSAFLLAVSACRSLQRLAGVCNMGSPVNRVSSLSKQGASSCPSSPVPSSKPDRSADYAAVRNLAESYGVDLLPLEMGFTPLRTQVKSAEKAAQRFSTADSGADFPNTPDVGETASSATGGPAGRTLDAVYSGESTASIGLEAEGTVPGRSSSPSKATGAPSAAAPASANQQLQVSSSGEALAGYPIDVDSGSELNTDSPSGVADFVDGEGAGAEGVYLDEEQLPIEERVTLLEVGMQALLGVAWHNMAQFSTYRRRSNSCQAMNVMCSSRGPSQLSARLHAGFACRLCRCLLRGVCSLACCCCL